jgi:hypothetical protein
LDLSKNLPDISRYEKYVMDECWNSYIKTLQAQLIKIKDTTESELAKYLRNIASNMLFFRYSLSTADYNLISVDIDGVKTKKTIIDVLRKNFYSDETMKDFYVRLTGLYKISQKFKDFVISEYYKVVQPAVDRKLDTLAKFIPSIFPILDKLRMKGYMAAMGRMKIEDSLEIADFLKGMDFYHKSDLYQVEEVYDAAKEHERIRQILVDSWNAFITINKKEN